MTVKPKYAAHFNITKESNREWYKIKSDSIDSQPGYLNEKIDPEVLSVNEEHKLSFAGDVHNLKNLDVYYGRNSSGELGFWTMEEIFQQVSIKPKGNFNPEEKYTSLDLVRHNGAVWVCLDDNTPIGEIPTEKSKYWNLILKDASGIKISLEHVDRDVPAYLTQYSDTNGENYVFHIPTPSVEVGIGTTDLPDDNFLGYEYIQIVE